MCPLFALDQVQLAWLTHEQKLASKRAILAHSQGPLFCSFFFGGGSPVQFFTFFGGVGGGGSENLFLLRDMARS